MFCLGLRRSSAPSAFSPVYYEKYLSKIRQQLCFNRGPVRAEVTHLDNSRLHYCFLQQLQCSGQHTLVLFLAAGGRQCGDECISMQQNVWKFLPLGRAALSICSVFLLWYSTSLSGNPCSLDSYWHFHLLPMLCCCFFFPAAFPAFPFAHSLLVFPCLLRTALASQAWSGMKKMPLMTTEREKQCSR